MPYDAIVVGAGPAGSTAARLLAQAGASVLLIDRAAFPRDKACGGGVTLRAASFLDIDLSPVVEQVIYGARFSLRLGPAFLRWYGQPLTFMTQRCRLDAYLAEAAHRAGARFHDGEPVRAVELESGCLTVRTACGQYSARTLVAADGANGVAARQVGLETRFEEAIALEGNVPCANGVPAPWRQIVALELGSLAGGYGWVFPKGDRLNVGVGAWKYAAHTLRPKLFDLCQRYRLDAARLEDVRGHHLPLRRPGSPVAQGPVLAIGDAAGLVDPLSGEGIHMAFLSARLAIVAYLSGETADLSSYQRAVERRLQPELTASRQLHELFHFAPPPYVAMMRRSRRFWHLFCHIIRGETTYQGFLNKVGPLRFLVRPLATEAQRRRETKLAALSPRLGSTWW